MATEEDMVDAAGTTIVVDTAAAAAVVMMTEVMEGKSKGEISFLSMYHDYCNEQALTTDFSFPYRYGDRGGGYRGG